MKKRYFMKYIPAVMLAVLCFLSGCSYGVTGTGTGTGIAVVSKTEPKTEEPVTKVPDVSSEEKNVTEPEPTSQDVTTDGPENPDVPDTSGVGTDPEVTSGDPVSSDAAESEVPVTQETGPVTTEPVTEPAETEPSFVKVKKITVKPADKTYLGRPVQMVAEISPANANYDRVTWSITSGSSYGSISADGVLSTYKSGKITVRATATDGSGVSGSYTFTPSNAALWSGKGTSASPYLIATAEDLYNLNYAVYFTGKYFRQTADIDLSEYGTWLPIGLGRGVFANNYDGNGKKITNVHLGDFSSLYTSSLVGYTGLFAKLGKCTVKNLTVEATGGSKKGNVGVLCGCAEDTTVVKCTVSGEISAGGRYCGGIAGMITGTVSDSSASVSITGSGEYCGGIAGYLNGTVTTTSAHGNIGGTYMCGGFVGYVYGTSDIHDCFSTGNVSAASPSSAAVEPYEPAIADALRPSGSFIGCLESAGTETSPKTFSVFRCYSSGTVEAECDSAYRAGFIGFVLDENSKNIYANGLNKNMYSDVKNNYTTDKAVAEAAPREFVKSGDMSDKYASEPVRIAGNITRDDLKKQTVFKGFDFSNVWKMGENGPELR